jgi:long-chain fatty acid transport protein
MQARGLLFRLLAVVLTFGVAALPTPLFASGFQLVEQNASGLGNAYAGQAAGAKNASAVFFNPALMTRVKGWNVAASVEPIGVSTTFANNGSTGPMLGTTPIPVPLGGEGGNAGKWIPVPNLYAAGQLGDKVWVGLGVNAPFGLETDWDPDWMGRFHATKSKVQALNVNPTVAFQVTNALSLGAGVNYQHLKADFNSAVPYGGLAYGGAAQALAASGAPPAVQGALLASIVAQLGGTSGLSTEGPALISGDSNAWGFNVGALLKVGEQAHVGVSYRSKIKHDITGTVDFQGAPTLLETGPTAAIGTAINANFSDGPVATHIDMPDTFSIAAAWEQDKVELLGDWTYTGWSSIQSLDIARGTTPGCSATSTPACLSSVPLTFQDTWRAGIGANLKMNDQWTLRLGTAYDKSPVQNAYRTPRLPDNDRVWMAAGFQWRFKERAHLDAGYAHIFVDKASSNLVEKPTAGKLIGEYTAKVDIVGAQLTLKF